MLDPPRRMPRAEREQQMLDAAHALFAQRGYAAVAMDDVAAAVGVTKPLLYNYWGNKERLPEPSLINLVDTFDRLTLNPEAVPHDLLGAAYEYLLRQLLGWIRRGNTAYCHLDSLGMDSVDPLASDLAARPITPKHGSTGRRGR